MPLTHQKNLAYNSENFSRWAMFVGPMTEKADLLILDEWLIRPLSPQESYDLLEIVEACCQNSMIFCTQYQSEGWYIHALTPIPTPAARFLRQSWTAFHNAYEILVEGRVSMRERNGLKDSLFQRMVKRMPDCPFNPSDSPCEMKLDLMIQYEAERESMKIFYAMWEELQSSLKHIQLLETVLTVNSIPISEYDG